MRIVIPARLGSKGLPFKNRKLFKHTADSIPKSKRDLVIVTSDDPEVIAMAQEYGFEASLRPSELAQDTSSTRDVLLHLIEEKKIPDSEIIVMLYLTYPERTWEEVLVALHFFLVHYHSGKSNSLLCRKEVKSHPYLCLEESDTVGLRGKQITPHDLYRRQDYPRCFEISHYICIFNAGSIYKLNSNLYCEETIFYPILDVIDVDTKKELDQFDGK